MIEQHEKPPKQFGTMFFHALYFIVGFVQIYAQVQNNDFLNLISKPLLMPILIGFVYMFCRENSLRQNVLIYCALIFCWLGDVLLMGQKFSANFFIFGLVGFLIGHIFYVIINFKNAQKIKIGLIEIIAFVPMLLWALFLLSKINGGFFIPILFYAIMLCTLYASAFLTRNNLPKNLWITLFCGVILFIISDSMIAINKFILNFENAGFYIMATYIIAQYMIILTNLKIYLRAK